MDLETARQIISDQGWTPTERVRRNGTPYLYAQKRNRLVERHIEERYIAPISRLEAMTKAEILAILNKTEAR